MKENRLHYGNSRGEDQFYPSANTLIQGSHYPTDKGLDRLSEDVHNQLANSTFNFKH
jgi:hypothetical protein